MTSPQAVKGANPCACGCGGYPANRSAKYIQGHRPPESDEQFARRFWAKVDIGGAGDCWPWTGYLGNTGYGQVGRGGRLLSTHRVAYELHTGERLGELYACHRCDNRWCCNPSHIFAGTALDNIRDMIAKGRAVVPVGEAASNARLSDADVRDIRRRREAGESLASVAARYGISKQYVGQLSTYQWRTTA